jgi:hypothetical protein
MSANKIYAKTSAYYNTSLYGKYLDVMTYRTFTKSEGDASITINKSYANRPDLLAYDLYGDADLWWVFTLRNPNVLRDPIFDFLPGVQIYVPTKATLVQDLGL